MSDAGSPKIVRATMHAGNMVKRLRSRLDHVTSLVGNPEVNERAKNRLRSEQTALNWALEHIEKTWHLAFEEAYRRDVEAGLVPRVWRHLASGDDYTEICRGRLQVTNPDLDMEPAVVYRSNKNGRIWVRPVEEFHDGRFEPVNAPAAIFAAKEAQAV